MERKIFRIIIVIIFFYSKILSQVYLDSLKKWTVSGNLEMYYNYNLQAPNLYSKNHFLVSYNAINQYDINFLNTKIEYLSDKFRFCFSPMYGSYMYANNFNEPNYFKFVDRLNIGIKLHQQKNIWLYTGVLPSHIGFESNYNYENWTASRWITSDNTPYYETGVRLELLTRNKKWLINFNVLNGWQNITYQIHQQLPSFGYQIQYYPNQYFIINSSTFVSFINSNYQRYFHNFYVNYEKKNIGIVCFFDLGNQKYMWFSYGMALKYKINKYFNVATKFENYNDEHNIILSYFTSPVCITNYSISFNFNVFKYIIYKIEYRQFISNNAIFMLQNNTTNNQNIIFNTLTFHL